MGEPEPKVSFIPCLKWVSKGHAPFKVTKANPSKEELQEIMKQMRLREAEYQSGLVEMKASSEEDEEGGGNENESNDDDDDGNRDVDDFYDMGNYDDEEEEGVEPPGMTVDLNSLLKSGESDEDSPDSDEDPEEFVVKADDNLIICGHVDGNVCMLEVYVFNNERGELFILNDMFLPSYPICLEWINYNPSREKAECSYAAVGCVTPEIGIWDLRVSGNLDPVFTLGSKAKKTLRHRDAVLDLAWHKNNRSVLASGSADNTVIVWDMKAVSGVTSIKSFEEKVQSLQWHPVESNVLLTGCCDEKVRLYDCRETKHFKTWSFDGEIERVLWDQFNPYYYYSTTDKGMVYCTDTRNSQPLWTLKAHEKEVTGICQSSSHQDILLTGSMDEVVKVWDLQGGTPSLVTEKRMAIGEIYTLDACPDVPYVFCAGGSKKDNHLYVWDSRENNAVLQRLNRAKVKKEPTEEPQPSTSQGTGRELFSIGTASVKKEGRIPIKERSTDGQNLATAARASGRPKRKNPSKKKRAQNKPNKS